MKTKAIIFDKDGTLMDFDSFWVTVTHNVIEELKEEMGIMDVLEEDILLALGVENGVTSISGVLCHGIYQQMGEIMHDILKKHGYKFSINQVTERMIESYHRNYERGIIKPTCDNICEVLCRLKNYGIKLVVVTTDDLFGTQKCLQTLGIEKFIDAIYTDDGCFPPKPDPYCIFDVLEKEGLSKSEVVMVGDTLTDTTFAKNGGIEAIGVAKCDANRKILAGQIDKVISDLSYIFEVLE